MRIYCQKRFGFDRQITAQEEREIHCVVRIAVEEGTSIVMAIEGLGWERAGNFFDVQNNIKYINFISSK